MTDEPLLDEIRRVRHMISERIGHDPQRIAEYYAQLQRQYSDRIVNLSGEFVSEQPTAFQKNELESTTAAPTRQ